jgi:DNA polymerase-1
VDGHALAYKMFHALPEMNSPAGAPTNAIFGFIKSLRKTLEELQPTHGAVVWDGGLSTERLALLPEYKAQRAPMPDSLRSQLSPLQQWVCLAGWECIRQDGTEADDIIGTLALEAERSGAEVLILSPDKDFMQIVSERVHLLRARGGGLERYTPGVVREKIGVAPEQIVDWLSLVGDASDHIEGVPGVGAKTAAKLGGVWLAFCSF